MIIITEKVKIMLLIRQPASPLQIYLLWLKLIVPNSCCHLLFIIGNAFRPRALEIAGACRL